MTLRDYLARIRQAATTTALFEILEAATTEAGLPCLAYVALRDHPLYGAGARPDPVVMTTFPEGWVARYFERDYRKIDPVLIHTIGIAVPCLWRWLPEIRTLDDAQRRVLDAAHEAGLRHGMTVPLIGPGGSRALLSLATEDESAETEPHLGRLGLYAAIFHIAFVETAGVVPTGDTAPKLSAMERACLRWVAAGKTSWETGKILGLSEYTVRAYLRTVLAKLGAKSRAMAVARAFHLGLLED